MLVLFTLQWTLYPWWQRAMGDLDISQELEIHIGSSLSVIEGFTGVEVPGEIKAPGDSATVTDLISIYIYIPYLEFFFYLWKFVTKKSSQNKGGHTNCQEDEYCWNMSGTWENYFAPLTWVGNWHWQKITRIIFMSFLRAAVLCEFSGGSSWINPSQLIKNWPKPGF